MDSIPPIPTPNVPKPLSVTLFGNRVVTSVNKKSYGSRLGT